MDDVQPPYCSDDLQAIKENACRVIGGTAKPERVHAKTILYLILQLHGMQTLSIC